MSKIETEAREAAYNGAPAQVATKPPVEVTVDGDSGKTIVQTTGGAGHKSARSVIEAAKARRVAEGRETSSGGPGDDGLVGSGPESDDPPAEEKKAKKTKEPAPKEEPAEEDEVGSGAEDEGDADPAASADDAPAGDETATDEKPEDGEKKDDPEPDASVEYQVEQVRAELADLEERYEEAVSGRRTEDFALFEERPAQAARQWIASMLGVDVDSDLVRDEAIHLLQELTWDVVDDQDLPEDKKAQLDAERLRRNYRLLQHRRQADKTRDATTQTRQRALEFARQMYAGVKQKFPALALVDIDGKSPEKVIVDTMIRAARAGKIPKDADDVAAFTEAIRLADSYYQKRAKTISARLNAHLTPKPSPAAPGGNAKPSAAKKPAPSPTAATEKSPTKPSTLPAAKAAAPPSRPGPESSTSTEANLEKKVVVNIENYDPEERRRKVLASHRNKGR